MQRQSIGCVTTSRHTRLLIMGAKLERLLGHNLVSSVHQLFLGLVDTVNHKSAGRMGSDTSLNA